jgi:outer membrane receptor protein involved in Fe transport
LLGLFFSHNSDGGVSAGQTVYATDPYTGVIGGIGGYTGLAPGEEGNDYERAVFANVTYHATSKFDIQFGARVSWLKSTVGAQLNSGPYLTGGPAVTTPGYGFENNHVFTYLFTPQYKLSQDLLIYARLASGYRPGGANVGVPGGLAPPVFQPDKTKNYELGLKGNFLDARLSLDASVYYIDWTGLQVVLTTPPPATFTYVDNAGGAKSEGAELSVQARLAQGLEIAGWITFNEAVLTKVPSNIAEPLAIGERMPYASRFSGKAEIKQSFSLGTNVAGEIGAAVSYVGDRLDAFNAGSRQYLPPYAKTDLHADATYRTWTINLYANNVTDRRGVISGGLGNVYPYGFWIIQPRTVGVSFIKTF